MKAREWSALSKVTPCRLIPFNKQRASEISGGNLPEEVYQGEFNGGNHLVRLSYIPVIIAIRRNDNDYSTNN